MDQHERRTGLRALPRLAAAAALSTGLVAAGGATSAAAAAETSPEAASIINAWPKKYTGTLVIVDGDGPQG